MVLWPKGGRRGRNESKGFVGIEGGGVKLERRGGHWVIEQRESCRVVKSG